MVAVCVRRMCDRWCVVWVCVRRMCDWCLWEGCVVRVHVCEKAVRCGGRVCVKRVCVRRVCVVRVCGKGEWSGCV